MKKVLIVDDHAELRQLIRITLEPSGCLLDEASDAESALQSIQAGRPDLLILDVMMPGSIDGYGLCARIKATPEWRDIFVVLLTARGQKTDIEQGQAVHCDAYLVKPFSPAALWDIIHSQLSSGTPQA